MALDGENHSGSSASTQMSHLWTNKQPETAMTKSIEDIGCSVQAQRVDCGITFVDRTS